MIIIKIKPTLFFEFQFHVSISSRYNQPYLSLLFYFLSARIQRKFMFDDKQEIKKPVWREINFL